MRIVVNDIVAIPGSGGIFSVLQDFYGEVLQYNEEHSDIEWVFLLSGNFVKETDAIKVKTFPDVKRSWFKRIYFEFFRGRRVVSSLNPDVYVSLQNTMTMGIRGVKLWTYLHQPLPYQREIKFSILKKSERKMWVYQRLVGKIINFTIKNSKTKVVVQTDWMKEALLNRKISKEDNIYVLPPNNVIGNAGKQEKISNTRFFYPATAMPYKNHKILFDAVKILEGKGFSFKVDCTITKEDTKKLGLDVPSSVSLLGVLSRKTVLKKYCTSTLVFPSLIETFGLPLLEASLSNAYILAGDTSFAKEILVNYDNTTFFDPQNAEDLADKMELCITNKLSVRPDAFEVVQKKKNDERSLVDLIAGG